MPIPPSSDRAAGVPPTAAQGRPPLGEAELIPWLMARTQAAYVHLLDSLPSSGQPPAIQT